MTPRCVLTGLLVGGLVAGAALAAVPASAEPALVALSPSLVRQLESAGVGPLSVMVHGATLAAAERAVAVTGMRRLTSFNKIGVVVARASEQQIQAARRQPGVIYLEVTSRWRRMPPRRLARRCLLGPRRWWQRVVWKHARRCPGRTGSRWTARASALR